MSLVFFCRHSNQIEHYEAEIAWYREQLIHERARAEMATDRLLATRGIGPVTRPEPAHARSAEEQMRTLLESEDFQRAGDVGE